MTAASAVMAEKKKPSKKKVDAHASTFVVRLPESYRDLLRELKDRTDRPITAMVRRALDAYLKANGVEPPKS